MKSLISVAVLGVIIFSIGGAYAEDRLEVPCSKDTFGRSNNRNQNSGGSAVLYISHTPMLRALVAFDLSQVTNQIVQAELVLNAQDTNEKPLNMVVSPLVDAGNNSNWREGSGALGTSGRNAQSGEATFSRCSFPDQPWETAKNAPATGLNDVGLWLVPAGKLSQTEWVAGAEIRLKLIDVALLEKTRTAKNQTITYGVWGTAGNGYYGIASRESGKGPRLILTLKKDK